MVEEMGNPLQNEGIIVLATESMSVVNGKMHTNVGVDTMLAGRFFTEPLNIPFRLGIGQKDGSLEGSQFIIPYNGVVEGCQRNE